MLNIRSEFDILTNSMAALTEEEIITDMNPGGVVRTLLEVMARETGSAYSSLKLNTMMGFISLASGSFLDLMGEAVSIPRFSTTNAFVQRTDMNIKFYTTDGSPLITYQPSGSIPASTTINSPDDSVSFRTVNDTAISASATEVYVDATTDVDGVEGNVGARTLTKHNLSSGNILVVNQYDIGTGLDDETDDNYRFRISNAMLDYARANHMSIRLAALSVPGVADVTIFDYRSGAGTFDLLIIPTGNTVPAATFRAVQTAVTAVKAVGTMATVRQPSYVPVQISVKLTQTGALSSGALSSVRSRVVGKILNYIGEIQLGGTFVLNELRQRVMETDGAILDMEVLCYVFRQRPQLLRNYVAESDELFLPDPSVSSPIQVV